MVRHSLLTLLFVCAALCCVSLPAATAGEAAGPPAEAAWRIRRGALLSADNVTDARLQELAAAGYDTVAIELTSGPDARQLEDAAGERIRAANLALAYWIEVARCPALADANPSWMASLQGHPEWRRLYDDPPSPGDDEVVKTYPWVPILNREPFDGQLARLGELLADRPRPDGVFLNDLQGGPSACGCGNLLCRWTTDYGKLRTTTPLGDDAAARFVTKVAELLPASRVVPVWTTECEEQDAAKDGMCGGVGCFDGICWRAYTRQLMPLARQCPQIGVLLPYRAMGRDLPIYGEPAGWIKHAIKTFQTMPPRHGGKSLPASRLIAVVQGWDVTDEEVAQQLAVADQAEVAGVLVAFTAIEQDWQPRIFRMK